jgi:hypothetical protein
MQLTQGAEIVEQGVLFRALSVNECVGVFSTPIRPPAASTVAFTASLMPRYAALLNHNPPPVQCRHGLPLTFHTLSSLPPVNPLRTETLKIPWWRASITLTLSYITHLCG